MNENPTIEDPRTSHLSPTPAQQVAVESLTGAAQQAAADLELRVTRA